MFGKKEIKEDMNKLKDEIDMLKDVVLEQQKDIKELKDKDKKPEYMG